MKWPTLHKAISALALLAIGCLLIVDVLLAQDESGLHILESDPVFFIIIIMLFYAICITGFVAGFRYAALASKKSKLFWVSVVCTVLAGLVTIPMSYEYIKDWIVPPSKGIFDNLNLFDTSENRKQLVKYQNILMLILALLQIASIFSIIRLRKMFQAVVDRN
jgi:hypothetical protein